MMLMIHILSGFSNIKTITIVKMPLFEFFYKTLSMHDAKVQPKGTTGQRTLKDTLLQKKTI